MASYWTRKDDQSDEVKTIKPWEEAVSNGDKFFPDIAFVISVPADEEPDGKASDRQD